MEATLEYGENRIQILSFQHSSDDEQAGNPYNCIFDIQVVSGTFSGVADGCELDYKELHKFIIQLNSLLAGKTDEVIFQEIGYGSKICFCADGLGHIAVYGTIYGNAMSHSLIFEFMTDQTVYQSFINELEKL